METENKYQRGKIYKLISNQTDEIYYGSTVERVLTNRLAGHRVSYKQWINKKNHYISSYEIVKYDDAKIILVESFPCNTKYELTAREQFYIDNFICVNKQKAPTGLIKSQYRKQYYKDHIEEIKNNTKTYKHINRDKYFEYNKKYYEDNKKIINEQSKQYYKNNKDKIIEQKKQKINCICGLCIRVGDKAKHIKTKKHLAYVASLNLIIDDTI